ADLDRLLALRPSFARNKRAGRKQRGDGRRDQAQAGPRQMIMHAHFPPNESACFAQPMPEFMPVGNRPKCHSAPTSPVGRVSGVRTYKVAAHSASKDARERAGAARFARQRGGYCGVASPPSTMMVSTSPAPLRRKAAAASYSSEVKQATPRSKVGNSITTKRSNFFGPSMIWKRPPPAKTLPPNSARMPGTRSVDFLYSTA